MPEDDDEKKHRCELDDCDEGFETIDDL